MRDKQTFIIGCLLAVFLLPCAFFASAQTKVTVTVEDYSYRVVKGKVTDLEGHSLPGVNVVVKGVQGGTVCDIDGNFKLSAPREDVIFVFTYVGMATQEVLVKANQKKEIQVRMKENVNEVNEVVITGFANIRKESFTGNAITIKKEELQKVSKTNVISALQAFDPSFRIAENSMWGSDPNALPEVYIRGKSGIGIKELDGTDITSKSSLKNNPNLPTFIMDGFEISVTKLYDMDPSRIESVTILKDAAATAMYGSRAANGVVVITTVTPKPGKINVAYSLTGEVEMPDLSDYNLLNAAEKLELERIAGCFEDQNGTITESENSYRKYYYQKLYNVQDGVETYWLNKPLRTSLNMNHSLYVDGGSEQLRFGIELNLNKNDGVMKGSKRDMWGAGAYIQYTIGDFVFRNHFTYDVNRSADSPFGSFSDYTAQLPYDVYKDENGELLNKLTHWGYDSNRYNPLYESTLGSYNKSSYEQVINNLSAQWNINRYLLFKSTLGLTRQFDKNERFIDPHSQKNQSPLSATNLSSGELYTGSGDSFILDWQALLSYNRFIGKHNINTSIGLNILENQSKSLSAKYLGFPSGSLHSPNYAQQIDKKPTQSEEHSRLMGLTGLINYSYNNIYLFDTSIRLDGSSKFGSDKKYAPFWSFGAGLNMHNYGFFSDMNIFDLLKLRGSYGQVGKVNFASYDAKTTYRVLSDQWYKTGYGAVLHSLGNKGLTWETTNTLDVGLEISMFKQLLYLKGSYYIKRTVDCINSVTIPSHSGFNTYIDNIGEVENKGFELDVRTNIVRTRDWNLSLFANLSHNENKIVKIAESLKAYNDKVDNYMNDHKTASSRSYRKYSEGVSQSAIWAMKSIGIDPATGEELYLNSDGAVTKYWDATNQVIIGDEEPAARGTFGFNLTWQRFSLYSTFMYEFGGQRYNNTLADKVEGADITNKNADKRVLTERWNTPGDLAAFKKVLAGHGGVETTKATSRFVQDYNWVNINSVTLEYDFDAKLIKPIGLSMLRFSIGANDLARWSSVELERGLNYPYSRKINFSLKASF